MAARKVHDPAAVAQAPSPGFASTPSVKLLAVKVDGTCADPAVGWSASKPAVRASVPGVRQLTRLWRIRRGMIIPPAARGSFRHLDTIVHQLSLSGEW